MADTDVKYEIRHTWATRRGVGQSVGHAVGEVVTAEQIEVKPGTDRAKFIKELLSLNLIQVVEVATVATSPIPLADEVATLPKPGKKAGALAEIVAAGVPGATTQEAQG